MLWLWLRGSTERALKLLKQIMLCCLSHAAAQGLPCATSSRHKHKGSTSPGQHNTGAALIHAQSHTHACTCTTKQAAPSWLCAADPCTCYYVPAQAQRPNGPSDWDAGSCRRRQGWDGRDRSAQTRQPPLSDHVAAHGVAYSGGSSSRSGWAGPKQQQQLLQPPPAPIGRVCLFPSLPLQAEGGLGLPASLLTSVLRARSCVP